MEMRNTAVEINTTDRLFNIGRLLLLITIALYPLIYLAPVTIELIELHSLPSRYLLMVTTAILAGVSLLLLTRRPRRRFHLSPIDKRVLFFLAVITLSGMLCAYPGISLLAPAWIGFLQNFQLWLPCILMYFAVRIFLTRGEDVRLTAYLLVGVGILVALFGIVDWAIKVRMMPGYRLVGTLINPMYAGTFFAMLFSLSIACLFQQTARIFKALLALGSVILVLALILAQSRAAWLGTIVVLPVIACMIWKRSSAPSPSRRWILISAMLVPCLLMIAMAPANPSIRQRLFSIFDTRGQTAQTRIVFMQTALRMWRAHPILGVGIGTFPYYFAQYRPSSTVLEGITPLNRSFLTTHPHNLLLHILSETGIIGLGAFLFILITIAQFVWRASPGAPFTALRIGLFGLLGAYLVTNLFAFDNAVTMCHFWVGLALLSNLSASPLLVNNNIDDLLLSRRSSMAIISCAVILVCSSLFYAGCAVTSAFFSCQGMIELRQQRQQNDLTKINTAVKHARSALLLGKRLTPMNYVVDLPLVISYREEIGLYQNNRERALRARDMMFATGEAGVKLFDRQPQLLRELLIQNIMWERFGEAERIYYLLERLEPHSADVHLLHADLLFAQGKVVRAVEETNVAVGLDPTFGEAYALQAHYKYKVAERIILTAFANRQHADPAEKSPVPKEVRILIADVCTLYSRARVNKEQMYPLFRYEFCLALLLLGENPVAIAEGKQLRDTPYFDRLCNKIMLIYNIKGQLKQGLKLVESLKEV